MEMVQVTQKVQLVDGCYTPSDANDLITTLVGEKIKFLKIQNLKEYIHDSTCDCKPAEQRITELMSELKEIQQVVRQCRATGKEVKVSCKLEITYDE